MKRTGVILLKLGLLVLAIGMIVAVVGVIRASEEAPAAASRGSAEQMAGPLMLAILGLVLASFLGAPMALAGLILLIVGRVGNKRVPTPREA